MALEGNLETFYLSSLFQLLSNDKKTGRLRLTGEDDVVTVNFSEGTIIFATSTDNEKHLGYLLRSEGIIGDIELENYLLIARNRKERLGKVLVDECFISKEELQSFVRMQAENILFDIFAWSKGKFRFEDCPVPFSEDTDTQFDTMELILEASRRVDELSEIQKQLPAKDQVLHYANRPMTSEDKKRLSLQENAILRLVNGSRTVREIIQQSGYDDFTASKAIHALQAAGFIEGRSKVDFSLSSGGQTAGGVAESHAEPVRPGDFERSLKKSPQIQPYHEKDLRSVPKKSHGPLIVVLVLIILLGAAGALLYTQGLLDPYLRQAEEPPAGTQNAKPAPSEPAQPSSPTTASQSLQDKNAYYFVDVPAGFTPDDRSSQKKSFIELSYPEDISVEIDARPIASKWDPEDDMYKTIADLQSEKRSVQPAIESYTLLSLGGGQGYEITTTETINAVFCKTSILKLVAYKKIISITIFCRDCSRKTAASLFASIDSMIKKSLLIYP